ncbi:tetratricopeptide repeat protein [Arenicella xantha]|uniref:Uncharacterized protein n=1 Tax=Arenicella xantha TaxID=644221 RepID=A0A395JIF3_9GAMM|nr:hypothetical protein [Arenicella xantha]RBP49907.1 hypothetical protein DFR28_103339 [Arenicella xantha]
MPKRRNTSYSSVYRHFFRHIFLLGMATTLIACVSHAPVSRPTEGQSKTALPTFNQQLFTEISLIEPGAITSLSAPQKAHFLNYFNAPINQQTPPHERVANYLGIILDQFKYSEKTLTAEKALQSMSGNCLSLVLVTDAFAKLSGINIEYQLLEQNPVYSLDNDLLIRSDHMRSVIHGPWVESAEGAFRSNSSIRIDYFQTDGLSYIDQIPSHEKDSMYYSNKAVEYAAERQYNLAFSHAKHALSINPNSLSALNTLGILHRRLGDNVTAESIYQYGSQRHPSKAIFLRNLSTILKSEKRFEELAAVSEEIKKLNSNKLAEFIRAGQEAEQQQDYGVAVLNYRRALAIAPDLHELHLYSAVANFKNGANVSAEKDFFRAIKTAENDPAKKLYEKKLTALQSSQSRKEY